MTEAARLRKYRGNCHCGAFVYEATVPEITSLYSCNCSICCKKAYLWAVAPKEDDFKVVKGNEDDLKTYQFGPKGRHHKFCPTCGCAPLGRRPDGPPGKTLLLNARCIQDLNVWEMPAIAVNEATTDPQYEAPPYVGPEPSSDAEAATVYHGSCHCGAVTVAVKTHALDDKYPDKIVECNCSICQRIGFIWIYPKPEEVVVQGEDNLVKYEMGNKIMYKGFCKHCGVTLLNLSRELSGDRVAALPQPMQDFYERSQHMAPVNIRILNGFDIQSVNPVRLDGLNMAKPAYVNP